MGLQQKEVVSNDFILTHISALGSSFLFLILAYVSLVLGLFHCMFYQTESSRHSQENTDSWTEIASILWHLTFLQNTHQTGQHTSSESKLLEEMDEYSKINMIKIFLIFDYNVFGKQNKECIKRSE